ncbi:MAG: hypothetical protein NE327_17855 [Lentisphaeraceae bacterium]|nr:hypothetical protein [Lentisphaeraceae bacterium]
MKFFKILMICFLTLSPGFIFAEEKEEETGETPQEALLEIKKLYETKNFTKLVKERYTEIFKADSPDEEKKIIEMLSKRYDKEKNMKITLSFLNEAVKVEPKVQFNPSPNENEDEHMAIFQVSMHGSNIDYKLYKMKNGKWGFHF